MTPPRGVEDAAPYSGNPEALLLSLTSAAARGLAANLPQQRFFRDSFLQGKRARASNARPYKRFSIA